MTTIYPYITTQQLWTHVFRPSVIQTEGTTIPVSPLVIWQWQPLNYFEAAGLRLI